MGMGGPSGPQCGRADGRGSCSPLTGLAAFDSGLKTGTGTFTQTFDVPGEVFYYSAPYCEKGMKGIIHVVA